MRVVVRLCQGMAKRLGWRSRAPTPDYLAILLASSAQTAPETLARLL